MSEGQRNVSKSNTQRSLCRARSHREKCRRRLETQAEALKSAAAVVRDALRDGVTTTKLEDYADSGLVGYYLQCYQRSVSQVDHWKVKLAALNGA